RNGPRQFFLHLRPSGIYALETQLDDRGINGQVIVGIIDARNHRPAAQIDALRLRAGQQTDFFRTADSDDALASYRQRLDVWTRGITRKNLSMKQDQIGRRSLAQSQ